MRTFTLHLSDADLNAVLVALGRQPHDDVFRVVQSLHQQAQAQLAKHDAAVQARQARTERSKARKT